MARSHIRCLALLVDQGCAVFSTLWLDSLWRFNRLSRIRALLLGWSGFELVDSSHFWRMRPDLQLCLALPVPKCRWGRPQAGYHSDSYFLRFVWTLAGIKTAYLQWRIVLSCWLGLTNLFSFWFGLRFLIRIWIVIFCSEHWFSPSFTTNGLPRVLLSLRAFILRLATLFVISSATLLCPWLVSRELTETLSSFILEVLATRCSHSSSITSWIEYLGLFLEVDACLLNSDGGLSRLIRPSLKFVVWQSLCSGAKFRISRSSSSSLPFSLMTDKLCSSFANSRKSSGYRSFWRLKGSSISGLNS